MITEVHGDILQEPEGTWIVIPVNCVGIAGAGLARQWSIMHPDANINYVALCERGFVLPGETYWMLAERGSFILAATKDHWSQPSQIEWIESILEALADRLKLAGDSLTLALPPIGCGLGGLSWDQVHDLIYYWLADHAGDDRLDRHRIRLYLPR